MLLSMSGKNGSEKTRELSSHTANAIDPVRRGAEARRPVAHIAEARDHLFDLTAGLRPYPPGSGEDPRRGRRGKPRPLGGHGPPGAVLPGPAPPPPPPPPHPPFPPLGPHAHT